MENPFDIFKPSRRICEGKTLKYPIAQLNPNDWLQGGNDRNQSIGIDGFIVNKEGAVTALMGRYEYCGNHQNRDQLTQVLIDKFKEEITFNINLAEQLNIPYRLFLWPENFPNKVEIHSRKIIVFFPKLKTQEIDLSEAKRINLKGLEAGIKKHRGQSYKSVKSLRSANSNVECHLANYTKNPWPGDIDGLLIDKLNNNILAIIEYKTHNMDSPIEQEYIGKYGKQDWRRFEVLYKLQNKIEQTQTFRPKLFFLVWGTKELDNHQRIKIDEIDQGEVVNTSYMTRPKFGSFSEELLELLIS